MATALRGTCVGALLVFACDPPLPPEQESPPEVPDLRACDPVADGEWPEPWAEAEAEVLARINELRAEGGRCGELQFAPAPPLRMHPNLRCAARLHTADMIERAYVSSVDPDGLGLGARLGSLEYPAATFAEVVAVVTEDEVDELDDAADVVTAWRDNLTSCWQLYARELTDVGVGGREATYMAKEAEAPQRAAYWTLSLAAPR
ncbi:CAP domain-containing protein [Nannocystis punicea]|uniref:CAP domain-containing protein n=1 Tax=Nannocystis punicea TaxID=2995304 RepID=A0ABY7HE36_9BACT|nr:CAP domain-containing protein [Nannocystis poenicansa]WAS97553.1 CAP domain-containing protein [Nannocystis poenicansa]